MRELPPAIAGLARFYARRGILREFGLKTLAETYRFVEGNRAAAGILAAQVYPVRNRFPEHESQIVALLQPAHLRFEELFDRGVEAVGKKDWGAAERELESALTHERTYTPCNLALHCAKNPPAAWYLLGEARLAQGRWREGREAFAEMLRLAPAYEDSSGLPTAGGQWLQASAGAARTQIVASFLEEGSLDQGIEEGLRLLGEIEAPGSRLGNQRETRAHALPARLRLCEEGGRSAGAQPPS